MILLLVIASLFALTACDSTEPNDDSKQNDVESTLSALDQQMGGLGDIQASPMLMAAAQMPDGLMDFDLVLPKIIQTVAPQNLSKNSANGKIFETLADTTIQNIIDMLDSLSGAHTYTGTQWMSDPNPADEIIIIFPFINLETNTAHIAKVRLHSILISDTNLGGDFEMYVDDVRQLWVTLDLQGTNLVSETAVPSLIDISGGMLTDNGFTLNFSLVVNNNGVTIEMGVAGLPGLTVAMSIDNFFEVMDSETDVMPNSISLGYGEVNLVINNFEVSNVGDDMGDVLYSGNKVGDLIVEQDGLYIVFNNGNKKNLADLMPNVMAMLEGVPL
jgi:hypothetical protein